MVAPPEFQPHGEGAPYGAGASSALSFNLHLTLAGTPIVYSGLLATMQAAITAPLDGRPPSITIDADALGVTSSKNNTLEATGLEERTQNS